LIIYIRNKIVLPLDRSRIRSRTHGVKPRQDEQQIRPSSAMQGLPQLMGKGQIQYGTGSVKRQSPGVVSKAQGSPAHRRAVCVLARSG